MSKIALSNARIMLFFAVFLVPQLLLASRLHLLVRENNVDAVREYLVASPRALFEINSRDTHLETPLQIAKTKQNDEMVALLLEHGAREDGVESGSPIRKINRSRDPEYRRSISTDLTPQFVDPQPRLDHRVSAPTADLGHDDKDMEFGAEDGAEDNDAPLIFRLDD